jgi:hypothetical protein
MREGKFYFIFKRKKRRATVPFGPLFHDATNDRYGNQP